MGKASKWFRGLLGLKSTDNNQSHSQRPPSPTKKKWTLSKSHKEKDRYKYSGSEEDNEASKHAIAVAAATAAVAEAAVAAAQAAAAVVQLTTSGRNISLSANATACVSQSVPGYRREDWAAVTIQSHFRAYLSRRALRALKALVKLQALVRGHLVRKQTAYALRRLQALVRAQVRARAGRALNSESPQSSTKSSHFNYSGPATPEKFENAIRARNVKHEHLMMLKGGSKSSSSIDHNNLEKTQIRRMLIDNRMSGRLSEQGCFTPTHPMEDDKILEVDTGNPHKHRPLFYSSHLSLSSDQVCQSFSTSKDQTIQSPAQSFCEVQSFAEHEDESAYNTPTHYSVSSSGRRAFTPTKSFGTRSCLSGYSDHPNYMSYTQSSKAKVRRSLSAPKQRPHFERSSSVRRCSVNGFTQFTNKAYPGSGRLARLGMPVRGEITIARDISETGLDYP
ncbi:hypothetical protein ACS0TY_004406 [Phlomoides rotata]